MMKNKVTKGPALWRQNVGDIPVEVLKELGEFEGKNYFLVKGTAKGFEGFTGVPEGELVQEGENID